MSFVYLFVFLFFLPFQNAHSLEHQEKNCGCFWPTSSCEKAYRCYILQAEIPCFSEMSRELCRIEIKHPRYYFECSHNIHLYNEGFRNNYESMLYHYGSWEEEYCQNVVKEAFIRYKNALHYNSQIESEIKEEFRAKHLKCFRTCHGKNALTYFDHSFLNYMEGNAIEAANYSLGYIESRKEMGEEELINSEELVQAGLTQSELGEFSKAIEYLTLAIEKDPENREAFFQRAVVHFEIGNFDFSTADYFESRFKTTPIRSSLEDRLQYASGLLNGTVCGAGQAIFDFVPSTCYTVKSIGSGLWAFTCSPKEVSYEMVQASAAAVEYIREHSTQEILDCIVPELKELCESWGDLSDQERGRQTGFILGKYGVEIFAPVATIKGAKKFKAFRDLKRANSMLTVEMAANSSKRDAIILKASGKVAAREKAIRNSTFVLGNKNDKIHLMQKKHNWQKLIKLSKNVEQDAEKVFDLLKEGMVNAVVASEKIQVQKNVLVTEYVMHIKGEVVRFRITTLDSGKIILKTAWVE